MRNPRYATINALAALAAYYHRLGDQCKALERQLIEAQGQAGKEAQLIDEAAALLVTMAQMDEMETITHEKNGVKP